VRQTLRPDPGVQGAPLLVEDKGAVVDGEKIAGRRLQVHFVRHGDGGGCASRAVVQLQDVVVVVVGTTADAVHNEIVACPSGTQVGRQRGKIQRGDALQGRLLLKEEVASAAAGEAWCWWW